MGSLLALLLPSLVPVATDAVRGLIGRFTMGAGSQPQNVNERIALMEAEAKKLAALAALDAPGGNIAPWVANFRASFRYFAIAFILISTVAAVFSEIDEAVLAVLLDLSGACMSFIIGERMYLKLSR